MQVMLNGKPEIIGDRVTLRGLLDQLGIGQERVAVEINGEIAPRSSYESRGLADGDRIEIVHFVGGG